MKEPEEALPAPDRNRPFNPLEKRRLAESIVRALLAQPAEMLPPAAPFRGAGIYALYYLGDHEVYADMALANQEELTVPIYVGKAVAQGSRKGGFGLDSDPGVTLFRRLLDHAKSIDQTLDLELNDFRCKYLVVDDFWIGLAESLMIENFAPIWNRTVDGFGNHDQGTTRTGQRRPPWDTLHPGRAWAGRMAESSLTADQIRAQVQVALAHLRGHAGS